MIAHDLVTILARNFFGILDSNFVKATAYSTLSGFYSIDFDSTAKIEMQPLI